MTPTDDIARRLTAAAPDPPPLPDLGPAARAAGLLDVAYATEGSPVGPLLLAATDAGLVRVAYLDDGDEDAVLAALADRVSPRVLADPARLDGPRRELDDYFAGRRRSFDVALDRRLMGDFQRRVLGATAEIPYGATSSYGAVARTAGSPRAQRAAGNALAANPLPIVVPCHRVLPAAGGIGKYAGGPERKRALLGLEAAEV